MEENTLLEARFSPKLGLYWLNSGAVLLGVTVVGIPLLLLWFPLGLLVTNRYIANMSAELTTKKLIVRKGILTRTENTVPLDKITDMAMIQGPLMRLFGIHKLTIETAGQSGAGALISLTGVEEVAEFRAAVMAQKSALSESQIRPEAKADLATQTLACLQSISETLVRIEARLTPPSEADKAQQSSLSTGE
ncbi:MULTISPECIES: PH domain-containing protein [Shewanella]|uniref:PH domain-containing protein n=1 Tax=Shewanella marisflavi TaxID=260364 RepID=A0ABX5WRV6_9GAMM|nr:MULTISPECIES: PH domain-containing protein [Shewanella]QDF77167.1 PH domain-containing protein [Shewanella marisflavi]